MFGHSGLSADLRWSVDDRVAVSVDELAVVVGVLVTGPHVKGVPWYFSGGATRSEEEGVDAVYGL